MNDGNYDSYNLSECEEDETLIMHLRNARNKIDSQCWILGVVQKRTNKIVL